MSAALPIAACIGLLSLTPPPPDGVGLTMIRGEARELQVDGRYGAAATRIDQFSSRLKRGPVKAEAERLSARYRALDRAWQRAKADPGRHARTFVLVLNAGGRWVPPTPQDAERAMRLALRGDPALAQRISSRYRLEVDGDRAFEGALRRELSSCGVVFEGAERTVRIEQTQQPRRDQVGLRTTVFLGGRARATGASVVEQRRLAPNTRSQSAAPLVMQALLAEYQGGRL
jgi:hypothetical protein